MGKSKSPPPPNYAAAAREQGAANKEAAIATAKLSNPNEIGPYGERRVQYGVGDVPTVTTTLSPEQRNLYDQDVRISSGLGDIAEGGLKRIYSLLGTPFDMSTVPDRAVTSEEGYNKALGAILSRNEPFQERARTNKDTELRNQGIFPGMEAYDEAMRGMERQENDFNLGAQDRAYSHQALQFSLDEKARQNELAQQSFLRQLPLNELNALRSGVQMSSPQFQQYQGAAVAPPPLFQAANAQYNAALDRTNAKNAASGGLMSGLFGLGSAGIGAAGSYDGWAAF